MTLDYYNKNAMSYSEETVLVEFQEQRDMLLQYLRPNAHILDLGCGSGRDSKVFIKLGYKVTAIDGSEKLCEIASNYIGKQVICKRFQDLDVTDVYDGVWACASLLHVPSAQLKQIFVNIARALKSGGYFYGSFKYGEFEGERNGRYFTDLTQKKLDFLVKGIAEFELVEVNITRDVRPEYEEEKWLNFIIRKI